MEAKIASFIEQFNKRKDAKMILEANLDVLHRELEKLQVKELQESSILLQRTGSHHRELSRKNIEELGTLALQYSLGPDYKMEIVQSEEKKRMSAEIFIVNKSTGIKTNPVDSNGGGIIDILGAAMRIVVLQSMTNPKIDGPIILDEPFKMLSAEYMPTITSFLQEVSSQFGRQIILITHNEFLALSCSQIYRLQKNNGKIEVIEEKSPEEEGDNA